MAPYEALYGRKCRSPVGWFEVGDHPLLGARYGSRCSKKIRIGTRQNASGSKSIEVLCQQQASGTRI